MPLNDLPLVLLGATGLLTAMLSAVAGVGGGTILIAVLYTLGLPPAQAVPLLAATQLVSNASRTLAYLPQVHWPAAGWFLLTAVPTTALLAGIAAQLDADAVRLLLGGLILFSLLPRVAGRVLPARAACLLAGALNGSIGLVVGATGLFVGRLFLRPEWRKETVIGTLALTQVLGHALRVLAYGVAGYSVFAYPLPLAVLCAAVIAGTVIGRRLNGRLDEAGFGRLFRTILVVLSFKLLADGAFGLWQTYTGA